VRNELLPGQDLVEAGLADLQRGRESVPALLVSIGAPRLRRLGVCLPTTIPSPELRLYDLLALDDPDSAHGRYNALIRRLVSYERATECEIADADRIRRLMRALGAEADITVRIYIAEGATAVLLGWRRTTIDVDLRMDPEPHRLLRALPGLKDELRVNIERASPADFIPVPPGWEARSPFIAAESKASFFHFDLYAQALAKAERNHAQDREDIQAMLHRGLIDPHRAQEYFREIEPELYRFPAIDPRSFRHAVEEIFGGRDPR